jgi:hypothetical protein
VNRRAIPFLRVVAALLAAAMFLPEAFAAWRARANPTGASRAEYFHGGTNAIEVPPTAGCLSAKCHRSPSHPRRRPESAFLNMHEPVVPCLGCHGKDPERRWKVPDPAGEERTFRVGYSRIEGGGGDPHGATGAPARCPRCHSASGREALAAAGLKGLADGFESPIPLRMLEGVGRKWLTEDVR